MKHRLIAPVVLTAALTLTAALAGTASAASGDPSQWGLASAETTEQRMNQDEGEYLAKVNEYEGQHLAKVNEYEGQHRLV